MTFLSQMWRISIKKCIEFARFKFVFMYQTLFVNNEMSDFLLINNCIILS